MVSIFNYGFDEAAKAFSAEGVKIRSLTDYPTLIGLAVEKGSVNGAQYETLVKWREDPENWKSGFVFLTINYTYEKDFEPVCGIGLFFCCLPGLATVRKGALETATISVPTVQCEQCKDRIEKACPGRGVQSAKVSYKKKNERLFITGIARHWKISKQPSRIPVMMQAM